MMRIRCLPMLLAPLLAVTSCSTDPDDSFTAADTSTGTDADTSGSAVDSGPSDALDSGAQDTRSETGDVGIDITPDAITPDTPTPDISDDVLEDPASPDLDDAVEGEVSDDTGDLVESDDAPAEEAEADLDPECIPRTPPDTSAPWMVLGTGFGMYEPLEACQNVPIIQGIQGGHHVWGGLATGGYDATDVIFTMNFELLREDEVIAEASFTDFLETCDGGWCYHTVPVIIDEALDPESLLGQRLTLALEMFPFDGEAPSFSDMVVIEPNEITF